MLIFSRGTLLRARLAEADGWVAKPEADGFGCAWRDRFFGQEVLE